MRIAAIIAALGLLFLELTLSLSCRYVYGPWIRYNAGNGDAAAQAEVAGYSYTGECGFQDSAKGRNFAQASAERNNRDGLFWLGKYQLLGLGGDEDVAGAVRTFEKLIDLGDIRGATNLGDYFMIAHAGTDDPKMSAYYYFRLMEFLSHESQSNTGHIREDSLKKAERLKKQLDPSQVDEVESRIRKWRAGR